MRRTTCTRRARASGWRRGGRARRALPFWCGAQVLLDRGGRWCGEVVRGRGAVTSEPSRGDAWIGGRLEEVDDQVREDVDGPEDEGHARDRREVGHGDAPREVVADAGPAEDLLDDDHPGEHEA